MSSIETGTMWGKGVEESWFEKHVECPREMTSRHSPVGLFLLEFLLLWETDLRKHS